MIPETFTADYTGEPGERAFFLQGRGEEGSVTFMIEKQQVAVLAEKLRELLIMIDHDDTVGSTVAGRDPALALDTPFDSETRIPIAWSFTCKRWIPTPRAPRRMTGRTCSSSFGAIKRARSSFMRLPSSTRAGPRASCVDCRSILRDTSVRPPTVIA